MMPPVYRLMSDEERTAAILLAGCHFPLDSVARDFAPHLGYQAAYEPPLITEKQAAMLWRQVWHYRKQLRYHVLVIENAKRILTERGELDPNTSAPILKAKGGVE